LLCSLWPQCDFAQFSTAMWRDRGVNRHEAGSLDLLIAIPSAN
jgi:hypothetical protein